MGLLGLFSCKSKTEVSNEFTIDFRPLLDTAQLDEVSIGELYLPTGKIVAGDPFFISDQKPYKVKVNPGSYSVKLLIHKVAEHHHRIAFAKN